jgi:hypothetical protein
MSTINKTETNTFESGVSKYSTTFEKNTPNQRKCDSTQNGTKRKHGEPETVSKKCRMSTKCESTLRNLDLKPEIVQSSVSKYSTTFEKNTPTQRKCDSTPNGTKKKKHTQQENVSKKCRLSTKCESTPHNLDSKLNTGKRRIEAFDRRVKKRSKARKSRVLSYFAEQKKAKEEIKKEKRARREAFEKTRIVTKIINDICKDVEKILFPPNSRIMSRKYDTAKHVVLHILATTVEKKNVIFDKEASDKKKEIFGYDWSNTCIWTGATTNLSVDHIFPIRGAYGNRKNAKTGWVKEGLRGSDSQWNTIMVYKTKNAGFKIFNHKKTHGWKKDISWQKLTSEELDQCTQQERGLYVKLQKWRMYARERGASFCWQFEENTNREIEKLYADIYKLLEERTEKLDVKLVPPSRVHERLAKF